MNCLQKESTNPPTVLFKNEYRRETYHANLGSGRNWLPQTKLRIIVHTMGEAWRTPSFPAQTWTIRHRKKRERERSKEDRNMRKVQNQVRREESHGQQQQRCGIIVMVWSDQQKMNRLRGNQTLPTSAVHPKNHQCAQYSTCIYWMLTTYRKQILLI